MCVNLLKINVRRPWRSLRLVWNMDPFLRIKKDLGEPTVQLGHPDANAEEENEGREDEEEEEAPVSLSR